MVPVVYDRGWRARRNGMEAPVDKVGELMAVRLLKGQNRVVFDYYPPLLKGSLLFSSGAAAVFLLYAWWARRHKVAAAVALYMGIGWVISLLFSIVGVLAMLGDTGTASFMLGTVSVMQTVVNLAVAAGGVALSAYLVRAKVDLS